LDASAYGSNGYSFAGSALSAGRTASAATDINGMLNLNNAALSVAGGSNSGTLTIGNGGLSLTGGTWNYAAYDKIDVGSGSLAITGVEYVSPLAQMDAGTYTLFTAANLPSGDPNSYLAMSGLNLNPSRQTYNFGTSGNAITLSVSGHAGNLRWTGGTNQTWDNHVSQSWFNTNSSSADVFYAGDNVTFNDTAGSANSNVAINDTVQPAAVVVSNTAVNYTFNGSGGIAGGTSLAKNGPGTLTINIGNTYTGATNLNAGILNANAVNALGTGPLNVSGGTVNLNYAQSVTSVAISNGLLNDGAINSLGTGALAVNSGTVNLNYSQSVSSVTIGSGLITVNDPGALGNGTLTINGGTLDNTSGNAVAAYAANAQAWNANFAFAGSNPLDLGAGGVSLSVSPTVTVSGTGSLTATGIITGVGQSLTKAGPGVLVLGGNNTYTGPTSVTGGTLLIQNPVATMSGTYSSAPGSTLAFSYDNGTVSQTSNIVISGSGTFQKVGGSRWFMNFTTFNMTGGTIDVEQGIFADSGHSTNFNNNKASLYVAAGATAEVNGNDWFVDALGGNGLVQLNYINNHTLVVGVNNGSGTFAGTINEGSGASGNHLFLAKNGTGTEVLTGAPVAGIPTATSSFNGSVTVNGGALVVAASASGNNTVLGNATSSGRTITANAGGTLLFAAPNALGTSFNSTNIPTLFITGGTVTNIDPLAGSAGSGAINNALNNVAFNNGVLTATTGQQAGYAAWNINGTIASSGTSLISTSDQVYGTVMLNSANGSAGTTTVNVSDGMLTISAPLVQSNQDGIVDALGKSGTGILLLTASNSYSGATSINSGTLQLGTGQSGQDGSIANTSSVADNAKLVYNLAGSQTANYAISGSGSLSMIGPGTLTLSGTNGYTGGTTVANGTLIATNSQAFADGSSLTVGNASAFSPAPVVPSPVVSASAAVSPVPEPGTMLLVVVGALAGFAVSRKKNGRRT
jgi:autotransporter-associated beta strand protein